MPVILPFKIKVQGLATVTNPKILTERAIEQLKDRYRRGLPDLEGYALPPEVKQALDAERKECSDGTRR